MAEHLNGGVRQVKITAQMSDGKTVTLIEKRSTVLDRSYRDGEVEMTVRIGRRQVDELLAGGARIRINGQEPHEALQQEWRVVEPPRPPVPRPVPPHDLADAEDS